MSVLLSTISDLQNEKYPHKIEALLVSHARRKSRPDRQKYNGRLTKTLSVSNFTSELVFPLSLIIFPTCSCPVLSFDLINCKQTFVIKQ